MTTNYHTLTNDELSFEITKLLGEDTPAGQVEWRDGLARRRDRKPYATDINLAFIAAADLNIDISINTMPKRSTEAIARMICIRILEAQTQPKG